MNVKKKNEWIKFLKNNFFPLILILFYYLLLKKKKKTSKFSTLKYFISISYPFYIQKKKKKIKKK